MNRFGMLLINNNRSKAYLQNLLKNGYKPSKVVLLSDRHADLPEYTENDKLMSRDTTQKFIRRMENLNIEFDEKEHVLTTLSRYGIEYSTVDTIDVNSEIVISEISKLPDEYVVYSGPGGTILRADILSQGKKFIHVHPGWLPTYRGSTTIYYSMLARASVGCSVILFEEGIDEGPVLYKQEYTITDKNVDFDYVLDPLVRAKALIEFFKQERIEPVPQNCEEVANTFYIIHPFLKHCSILKYSKGK